MSEVIDRILSQSSGAMVGSAMDNSYPTTGMQYVTSVALLIKLQRRAA